jgi:glycosyltransferase involved in cell wall biosynthesis
LFYLARALRSSKVDVRVYSLTRGDYYEGHLKAIGVPPVYIGRYASVLYRLVAFVSSLQEFQPHVIQSAHFFTNLYVAIAARFCGAVGMGTVRSDGIYDRSSNGRWGRWLLNGPAFIVTNSLAAWRNASRAGRAPGSVKVLFNVVDLVEFDQCANRGTGRPKASRALRAAAVGSLIPVKRFDLFLRALALARRSVGVLGGLILGDGPERARLEALARDLGLTPDGVTFLGRREDVPELLAGSDILVLTSDHEGFPNVVLEGMAAGLPIVTTPAGDAPQVVRDGVSGYVVPFDDAEALASRIVELAKSAELRERLGQEGRRIAEQKYSLSELGPQALSLYAEVLGGATEARQWTA